MCVENCLSSETLWKPNHWQTLRKWPEIDFVKTLCEQIQPCRPYGDLLLYHWQTCYKNKTDKMWDTLVFCTSNVHLMSQKRGCTSKHKKIRKVAHAVVCFLKTNFSFCLKHRVLHRLTRFSTHCKSHQTALQRSQEQKSGINEKQTLYYTCGRKRVAENEFCGKAHLGRYNLHLQSSTTKRELSPDLIGNSMSCPVCSWMILWLFSRGLMFSFFKKPIGCFRIFRLNCSRTYLS